MREKSDLFHGCCLLHEKSTFEVKQGPEEEEEEEAAECYSEIDDTPCWLLLLCYSLGGESVEVKEITLPVEYKRLDLSLLK